MIDIKLAEELRTYFRGVDMGMQEVLDLYRKYQDNLAEYLFLTNSECSFLSYRDFASLHKWGEGGDDSYLSGGAEKLAQSLVRSGAYWPVFYRIEAGKIIPVEGSHRIYALSTIHCSREILSIRSCHNEFSVGFKLWIMWPFERISLLAEDHQIISIEFVRENLYMAHVADSLAAYKLLIIYSMFLSELLYKVKPAVEGAHLVNSREEFRCWYYKKLKEFLT